MPTLQDLINQFGTTVPPACPEPPCPIPPYTCIPFESVVFYDRNQYPLSVNAPSVASQAQSIANLAVSQNSTFRGEAPKPVVADFLPTIPFKDLSCASAEQSNSTCDTNLPALQISGIQIQPPVSQPRPPLGYYTTDTLFVTSNIPATAYLQYLNTSTGQWVNGGGTVQTVQNGGGVKFVMTFPSCLDFGVVPVKSMRLVVCDTCNIPVQGGGNNGNLFAQIGLGFVNSFVGNVWNPFGEVEGGQSNQEVEQPLTCVNVNFELVKCIVAQNANPQAKINVAEGEDFVRLCPQNRPEGSVFNATGGTFSPTTLNITAHEGDFLFVALPKIVCNPFTFNNPKIIVDSISYNTYMQLNPSASLNLDSTLMNFYIVGLIDDISSNTQYFWESPTACGGKIIVDINAIANTCGYAQDFTLPIPNPNYQIQVMGSSAIPTFYTNSPVNIYFVPCNNVYGTFSIKNNLTGGITYVVPSLNVFILSTDIVNTYGLITGGYTMRFEPFGTTGCMTESQFIIDIF